MSESLSVLITAGSNQRLLKNQTYTNLSIAYNPSTVTSPQIETNFYNQSISASLNVDIYGFMSNNTDYTYDYSIESVVKFFTQDQKIEELICDLISQYQTFQTFEYLQADSPENNVPFFIRGSVKDKIHFSNKTPIFQNRIYYDFFDPNIIVVINEVLYP